MLQTVPNVSSRLKPLNGFKPRVNGWNEVQKALRQTIDKTTKQRSRQYDACAVANLAVF